MCLTVLLNQRESFELQKQEREFEDVRKRAGKNVSVYRFAGVPTCPNAVDVMHLCHVRRAAEELAAKAAHLREQQRQAAAKERKATHSILFRRAVVLTMVRLC